MVFGVSLGSLMTSFSVAIASPWGLRRCSGLKSKRTNGSRATLTAVEAAKAQRTSLRRSMRKRSTGAMREDPTSSVCRRGRKSRISAGSRVTLSTSPMTMPTPAMIPSSETPMYWVGRKARKPRVIATAARASEPPMPVAAATSAALRSSRVSRSARKRTLNWMPKSTPRPTNSGMKATEIRLNRPTVMRPAAVVSRRPIRVVSRIAPTNRADFTASPSMTSTARPIEPVTSQARSVSEANSSSERGTEPVRRTRTPWAASRPRLRAAARMASSASAPGIRPP